MKGSMEPIPTAQGADLVNVEDIDRVYQTCKEYIEEERLRGGIHLKALIRAASFFMVRGEDSYCAEILDIANMIVTLDDLISRDSPKIDVFEEIVSHSELHQCDSHDVHVIIDATAPEHKRADVPTLLNVAAFLIRIRALIDWKSHSTEKYIS